MSGVGLGVYVQTYLHSYPGKLKTELVHQMLLEVQESILQLDSLVLAQVDGFLELGLLLLCPLLQLLSRQAG